MAVYTTVDDHELNTFLAAYDLGNVLSFAGIAEGVENSNYLLRTDKAHYILTLYEKRVNADDLPFFIELMTHLAVSDMDCPLPVPARDGSILQELRAGLVLSFPFLTEHHRAIRIAINVLRLAVRWRACIWQQKDLKRTRQNALGPTSWQPLLDSVGNRANEIAPGMQSLVQDRLDQILATWPKDLPQGVIHADLFPNNVLFMGDRLTGIIDFYFACADLWPMIWQSASIHGVLTLMAALMSPSHAPLFEVIRMSGH